MRIAGSIPSDIEGAAVIGGNFSGATVHNNPGAVVQPAGYGSLTVFGNTSGNTINMDNSGSAYVGGTRGANISFNGGGYIGAPGSSISSFSTPLNALSLSLAGLAPTAAIPTTGNNEVFKAIAGANGIAVFSLTAAQLAAIPGFSVNLNGASTVVFNVSGSSATDNANDESGSTGADKIIWNFYNATGTVAINTLIGGTVLAPLAAVSNGNQIDGDLIANAWNGSGELHEFAFDGVLPSASVVPEPASMAVLGVGMLVLAGVRRRSRPAASPRAGSRAEPHLRASVTATTPPAASPI